MKLRRNRPLYMVLPDVILQWLPCLFLVFDRWAWACSRGSLRCRSNGSFVRHWFDRCCLSINLMSNVLCMTKILQWWANNLVRSYTVVKRFSFCFWCRWWTMAACSREVLRCPSFAHKTMYILVVGSRVSSSQHTRDEDDGVTRYLTVVYIGLLGITLQRFPFCFWWRLVNGLFQGNLDVSYIVLLYIAIFMLVVASHIRSSIIPLAKRIKWHEIRPLYRLAVCHGFLSVSDVVGAPWRVPGTSWGVGVLLIWRCISWWLLLT